jgi:tetratricopeptide (TPR) repeat protein
MELSGYYAIEEGRRLSQSAIWEMQEKYYSSQGVEAWRTGTVPHYVTSNPFVGRCYADVVLGYLRDCRDAGKLDPSQPIYILEIGSGPGRFAYHFLRAFFPLLRQSALRDYQVKYVLSDLAPNNMAFWRGHPKFASYFAEGLLDCALFDAAGDTEVKLQVSGETIGAGGGNPLVVFANYVFDSIPTDFFWVGEGGVLHECLVHVYSSQENDDPADPQILKRVHLHFERRPLESPNYYDDPVQNEALWRTAARLPDSAFAFPARVIQCLEVLRQLSGGNLLLMITDKGYNREVDLQKSEEPRLSIHGSFSVHVNYLAMAQYFELKGGRMFGTSHGHVAINTVGFVLGEPAGHPETGLAYEQAVNRIGPDEFFAMKRNFDDSDRIPNVEIFLALLRMSAFDARILVGGMPKVFGMLGEISDSLKHDLAVASRIAWETYYSIGEPLDFDYQIGAILAQLGYCRDAIECFYASAAVYPKNATTQFNIGLCAYYMGDLETAAASAARALELDPALEDAQKLQAALAAAAATS